MKMTLIDLTTGQPVETNPPQVDLLYHPEVELRLEPVEGAKPLKLRPNPWANPLMNPLPE